MGRGGWRERGPILTDKGKGKRKAVLMSGGAIVVVSQLTSGMRRGRPRSHKPPPRRPKLRVAGDELMRAMVAGRSYAALARAVGRGEGEVSRFCRGLEKAPSIPHVLRFARVVGVEVGQVVEALEALWQGRETVEAAAELRVMRRGRVSPRAPESEVSPSRLREVRPELARLLGGGGGGGGRLPTPPPGLYQERDEAPIALTLDRGEGDGDPDAFLWDD